MEISIIIIGHCEILLHDNKLMAICLKYIYIHKWMARARVREDYDHLYKKFYMHARCSDDVHKLIHVRLKYHVINII